MNRKIWGITTTILIITLVGTIISLNLDKLSNQECKGPVITFTFDDGYKNQYETAFPILKKYKIPATSYLITELVGKSFENHSLMEWNEIKNLEKNGWEIGSHTQNHKNLLKLNNSEIEKELELSKKTLEEKGFKVKTASIPYGKYNETVEIIAKKYYTSIRPSEMGINYFNNLQPYHLQSYWLTNMTTIKEMKELVDKTEEQKAWTIIMVHHVKTNLSEEYNFEPDKLEEIIKYIKDKDIPVKTITEVIDRCG